MIEVREFFILHPYIVLILFILFTLIIGSFLNVVIHRLPIKLIKTYENECKIFLNLETQPQAIYNLSWPPSHCVQCKKTLRPWHNIPIISYIFLRGQCAYCDNKISLYYPFIEFLTTLISCIVILHFGFTLQGLFALMFSWILIALTFIDLRHFLLPDELTLSLLWIGLIISIFNIFCNSTDAILGAVIGYLLFALIQSIFGLITGKTGIGQGDYKLLAALGAFLGWQVLPALILISSFLGIIGTLFVMIYRKSWRSVPLPFGPYLAIAGWICLLCHSQILHHILDLGI